VPYSVDSRFSFVDLEDVGEVAKRVLTEPSHQNANYELAGTLPTTHVEVAEVFSWVLKREVKAEKEEIRDWRPQAKYMSQFTVENLIKMFEYYDRWGLFGNPTVLRWLLKREPTSLRSFIQRTWKEYG
jgi:hypothetical protein